MFTDKSITSPISHSEDIFDRGERVSIDDVNPIELSYEVDYAAECDKLTADYVDQLLY